MTNPTGLKDLASLRLEASRLREKSRKAGQQAIIANLASAGFSFAVYITFVHVHLPASRFVHLARPIPLITGITSLAIAIFVMVKKRRERRHDASTQQ